MKIIEIIPSLKCRGGAETFFVDLSVALSKLPNIEIIIIILYSDCVNDLYSKNIRENNIKTHTCGKKRGIDIKAAKKLKSIINDFNPDVINTHLECLATYFLAFNKKQSWKVFHTCHNIAKKETTFLNRFLRKLLLKKNMVVNIGISKEVAKTIIDCYGKKYCVPIINNGIKLRNEPKYKAKKEYDFICIGRFVLQKNQKFLIESLRQYYNQTGVALNLVFVGDGPMLEECKQLAKDIEYDKYILFTGSIDDVYPYLALSKIFVLSSIYEGNPISILEAIDCSLPVISTDVGGVKDIVKNGINGYLYRTNDYQGFCKCLDAIRDENNYNIIRHNNSLKRKELSIENTAKHYLKVFNGN